MLGRVNSAIRVLIQGDAKSLQKAAAQSEAAVGGLNKKIIAAGGAIAGAFVVDQLITFGNTAVQEADRVGDATGILEAQLGDLAQPLIDAADEFSRLGASEGDMLELETAIVNMGTALGITKSELAGTATEAATTAAALELITDTDADTWIDQIGKAATGSERALRALGVSVTDAEVEARALATTGKATAEALTEGELAAARLELVLEKLSPRITEVTTGTGDLEQKQAQLQARMETLSGQIGGPVSDVLGEFLGLILVSTDALANAKIPLDELTTGFKLLVFPILAVSDALRIAIGLLEQFLELAPSGISTPLPRGAPTPLRSRQFQPAGTTNVYVQGGSPEVIEQSVRNALRIATGRGPLE